MIMDGKALAAKIKANLKESVDAFKQLNNNSTPCLAVIQVGNPAYYTLITIKAMVSGLI